jgi:hypothetical protein
MRRGLTNKEREELDRARFKAMPRLKRCDPGGVDCAAGCCTEDGQERRIRRGWLYLSICFLNGFGFQSLGTNLVLEVPGNLIDSPHLWAATPLESIRVPTKPTAPDRPVRSTGRCGFKLPDDPCAPTRARLFRAVLRGRTLTRSKEKAAALLQRPRIKLERDA